MKKNVSFGPEINILVDYNEKLLSENKIDSSRLNDSKNSLNIIRGELEKLDSFYEDINKISFV